MSDPSASQSRPARVLLDTHVLIWHMEGDKRIGSMSRAEIDKATASGQALVAAITPWEIALLVSKGRIKLSTDVMVWVHEALAKPGLHLAALEPEIAVASTRLPFEMHPDPADRIIIATARHLGATLVTADQVLLGLAKKGHFRALNAEK